MGTGALTQHLDVAQVVLYVFWVFFAGLIIYLRQEDRREGYPLENAKTGEVGPGGWPFVPDPKTFKLPHGQGTFSAPNDRRDNRPLALKPIAPFPGAPADPTGNPLVDGVGPASYAERADVPDMMHDGSPKIVPLSTAPHFHIPDMDVDPRGLPVYGVDKRVAGKVVDLWIDKMESVIRYVEVETLPEIGGGRRVLLPNNFAVLYENHPTRLFVIAIMAEMFGQVPATKSKSSITLLEEDKICGYYGGGQLYGHPGRAEPIL